MKKQLPGFAMGFLSAVLLFSMTVSGFALISKRTTIEVDPVNIQVNGEVFQPADGNGNPVDVFAYNGTTYAPLRALAEAYGLEVGYDAEANMATVEEPGSSGTQTTVPWDNSDWSEEEEAKYQEFKAMWEVTKIEKGDSKAIALIEVTYVGNSPKDKLLRFMSENQAMVERYIKEQNTDKITIFYVDFYFEKDYIAHSGMNFGEINFTVY